MKLSSSVLFAALYAANSARAAAVPASTQLDDGKVLLHLGDGNVTIIDKADLAHHLGDILPEPPAKLPSFTCGNFTGLEKRAKTNEVIVPLSDLSFLGWDIPMSNIVHAKDGDATVAMTSGESISNGISAGGGVDLSLVKEFLSVSAHVDYSHSVTAEISGTITQTVPRGKWGLAVSNPRTYRRRGYVMTGQPGSARYDYWQADSFTDQSYSTGSGTLKWVAGVTTTCSRDTYPIHRCVGDGYLE